MTNDRAIATQQQRVNIIQTVQTPLGFFTLVVLIVEVIFGMTATYSQGLDRTILVVGMIIFMFFLVGIVAYLTYFKPGTLTREKGKKPLTVNLKFNGLSAEDAKDLQFKESILELYDLDDKISKKSIVLTEGQMSLDVWTFQISDDSCKAGLKIIDTEDREWRVKPFYLTIPYVTTRDVWRS